MALRTTVEALYGKHYGTKLRVHHPNGKVYGITVWMPEGPPSAEDLEGWGLTPEQWVANVEVDDGWGGWAPIQQMYPSDGHYQSRLEAAVAQRIAAALDGMDS